jgi:hypothetical protein
VSEQSPVIAPGAYSELAAILADPVVAATKLQELVEARAAAAAERDAQVAELAARQKGLAVQEIALTERDRVYAMQRAAEARASYLQQLQAGVVR